MGAPDAHRPPSVPCDCSAAAATCASVARARSSAWTIRLNSPYRRRQQLISRETFHAFTAESGRAARARGRCRVRRCPRFCPGDQGRRRHVGLDRLRAADAGEPGRHLQEERPRRVHQEDPAEGPPPGDRVGRHPVRGHHGGDLDRVERQRRRHQADLPARQVLRRRRHGRAQRRRLHQGPQGQDGGRLRARHRALLHAGLVPEEERPVREGRDGGQPGARRRRAGLRRRPERRRHDLRALSVDRSAPPPTRARSSPPRSTIP